MNSYKNAGTTSLGRQLLIARIGTGVSLHVDRKWLRRCAALGEAGLMDRSSRIH